MQLRYVDAKGHRVFIQLGAYPLTVGRAPDADIVLDSANVSRYHCAVRQWDNDYVIKDMHSENGTVVNGQRIDIVRLYPGDKITIGTFVLYFEKQTRAPSTPNTTIRKIGKEMVQAQKGYSTMLVELVKQADEK